MKNKDFINKVTCADDTSLLKLYHKYMEKVKASKNSFKLAKKQDYENSYINVKLNELHYLFATEKLDFITKEIQKRGILV